MKDFFKGVRKHIDKLGPEHLREQYRLVADEFASVEMLLHALKEGIIKLDASGAVTQVNAAARTLLGGDPETLLPALELPLGRASKREIELTYPEPRWLEAQTIPLGDDTLVILRDVTAEKVRTEEELQAGATRAVRDLAAGVAHEIGNPLNAIALNLQLLGRNYPDEPSIAECRAQVKRLDGIIRDFLQALRPSRPNLAPGSLAEPLKACLATLKPQFEERRITVTVDMPSALPPVALDRDRMEQVCFNLVKNALEAMHDGGTLAIAFGSDDNDVTLAIRDDGAGMDDEQLAHLFEPYRTSKAGGHGLGLMIVSRIVHEHGGTVAAESALGRGTTFTVRLPRLERRVRALGNHPA